MIVFIRGRWIKQNEATVPINDSAFLLGDGIFETFRFENNNIPFLDKHLDRLFTSVEQLRYNFKYNYSHLENIIFQIIEKNKLESGIIRIIVSRGNLKALNFSKSTTPNLYVLVKNLPDPVALPVKIMLLPASEFNQREGNNILKTLSYAGNIQALKEAEKHSIFEPVFYNENNEIKEGATKNIFFIKDNKIFTPSLSLGILKGVMREIILDVANQLGIKHIKKSISTLDIHNFDEIFLSSSIVGPMPCTYENYKSTYSICKQIKDEIGHLYKINFY